MGENKIKELWWFFLKRNQFGFLFWATPGATK
jgi:hypothetical protein